MKITKSQLKELIRNAIVEDIMDKDIENPKTGNKIKIKTALQLPDDHPANKKAKDMVAKSSPEKSDEPMDATPAPKGKSKGPVKNPFSKESPAYDTFDSEKPDDEPSDDSGGPSYSDVPKGAKTSKQAKLMKKNDNLAKQINPNVSDSIDLVMNGMADDIDEFMNEIPDMGQDFEKADELLNLVRDNEQGMRDDDDDVIKDYKKGILKTLSTPGKGGSGKSGKDIEKQAMSAADAANAKMDRDEKLNDKKKYLKDLQKALKGAEPGSAFEKMYKDNIKKAKADIEKLQSESIKESVSRRFTVKEVRMWMKKLEENRYKKVYNSDARRVAWLANNNLSEDYESMPVSMRKKWSKAQYGRERYLAKEFLKSKLDQLKEQLNEMKLRKAIRGIIREQLNEKSFGDTRKIKFDKKDSKKVSNIITSRKWKFTTPLYKSKGLKHIELHVPKKEYDKTIEFFMKNKLNPRG